MASAFLQYIAEFMSVHVVCVRFVFGMKFSNSLAFILRQKVDIP
ncbi:hypothetical protein SAMN06297280_0545 [Arsukibacterium tuosuense]|uniref:Uncharacterized protein n=1 Tax=Arsukibacterium tuosuense TaxID=1323745 RepID=A0A285I5K5_9GAMM|nr:hypothetical protein SAMN06297280_0545 [Arsukibacterium tuosuense]